MTLQPALTDFDKRQTAFAKTRDLLLELIEKKPNQTTQQLSKLFLLKYQYLPTVDNRLRELRDDFNKVESRKQEDGLLHWFVKEDGDKEK